MVSERQKEFNGFIEGYIRERRKHSGDCEHVSSPKPKPKMREKVEAMEERELEVAEEKLDKKGFFERISDLLFGSEVVVEEEVAKMEISKPPQSARPRNDTSGMPSLMHRIFAGNNDLTKTEIDTESQAPIQKVVIFKPKAEEDTKEVVRLMESLLKRVSWYEREQFIHSSDYLKYEQIKHKYR